MNNEIKELIQMSCLTGEPNNDAKNLIYEKAIQHNISKQECDIYISGFLINANKDVSGKTHIYGYILYFSAFWDVFWGLTLTKDFPGLGFTIMFFGAVMYYFSFRLMKKNSLTTKILGLLLVGEAIFILTMVILKGLRVNHTSNFIIFLVWSILTSLILILFRRILLPGNIASKIDNLFLKSNNQVMILFFRISIFCFLMTLFNSCGSGIDKDKFNLADHIEDNDGIIQELRKWKVDSAYIEIIGFPPSTDIEHYIDLQKKGKIGQTSWETGHLFINRDYAEEFFNSVNMEYPILVVWALRKNTVKGNSFDDAGISSNDMVDYKNGVNMSQANSNHTLGNYSRTSYDWSPFYLVKVKNEYLMLTRGYPEDREIIGFFEDLIILNKNYLKNYVHSSKNVALYKKNKPMQSVQPMRLNQIKQNNLFNLNWSSGDSTNLEVNLDNVFFGSTYKIINSKRKEVASGKIKSGTNYIDLKNVSRGKLQFQIGSIVKQSIFKSTKSILDTWTSNDGVARLNFYSNSSFEMVIADDKNELKYFRGQIDELGSSDILVTSGDYKGLHFRFHDKIISLLINRDEFRYNDRNSQLSDDEVNSISTQLLQLTFYQI